MRAWKAVGAAALLALPTGLAAQETLIHGAVHSGGFGGVVLAVSDFGGRTGLLVGGQGAWVINDTYYLGGGGEGLATRLDEPSSSAGATARRVDFGYGGVILGYIRDRGKLVHLYAQTMIGAGGLGLPGRGGSSTDTTDSFFVIEPAVAVELNVTTFFRASAGASFRVVRGVETDGPFTESELGGPAFIAQFRFGR